MSKEKLMGIVRHVLTFVGGGLVILGYTDDAMVQELIGGVLAVVGTVWSIVAKKSV
jgi:hypothetical protein